MSLRTLLLLILFAAICFNGTFTCTERDDDAKVQVDTR